MKTIETQLECKATASLQDTIEKDMNQEDKSIASLLKDATNEKDDTGL